MEGIPWYKELFGEDYVRLWARVLSPERTAQEVQGIITLLGLPIGSTILDLACGYGRHAIPLAAYGYAVTGLDLSEFLLRQARAETASRRVEIRWVQHDMRDIPFTNEFDAVINIFTAFGYLESDEEDQKVLQQVYKALKPGGLFLLETIHRDNLIRRFAPSTVTRYEDGLLVLEERRFDFLTSRNDVRMTVFEPNGRRREHRWVVRHHTLAELAAMLARAALPVQAYYGGLDGSTLTFDSRRLVVIGRKAD